MVLGAKIKKYRERAGMSQLDLEFEIQLSPGSLSRIESGRVNPTKETLYKFIEALDLDSHEAADLFDIDVTDNRLPSMVQAIREIHSELSLEDVLRNSVEQIASNLDLLGALIFLMDGNVLQLIYINKLWFIDIVEKVIGKNLTDLKIDVTVKDNSENYIYQAIRDDMIYKSDDLYNYAYGVFSKRKSDIIQKITHTKSLIALPMKIGDEVSGAMLFSRNYQSDFSEDLPLLREFVNNVGLAINNARKFEQLMNKINEPTNSRSKN